MRTQCMMLSGIGIYRQMSGMVQVKSWAALPQFLREWGQPEMAGKLDTLSAELHDSWRLIKTRLRKHVGRTVCALATGDQHLS